MLSSILILAQETTDKKTSSGSGLLTFLPILLIGVAMYFLLIRPQRRRMKEQQALVSQLDEGGDIDISLRRDPLSGMLVVTVENDGKLTAPEPVGFGLTNCRRRIALVTEGLGSLDLREVPGPKVEAKLIYPWDERQLDTGAENRYAF